MKAGMNEAKSSREVERNTRCTVQQDRSAPLVWQRCGCVCDTSSCFQKHPPALPTTPERAVSCPLEAEREEPARRRAEAQHDRLASLTRVSEACALPYTDAVDPESGSMEEVD